MRIFVEGQEVCTHCIGDIAKAADKAGLVYLEVVDVNKKVWYWQPGLKSLRLKK